MKNFFLAAVVAVVSMMSVTSCDLSEAVIQANVMKNNAACPMEMGNGLTLTHVEYAGMYVEYSIKFPEGTVLTEDKELINESKKQIISSLQVQASMDKDTRKFIDALKKSGVGVIYHYYVPGSDTALDIVIHSHEIL